MKLQVLTYGELGSVSDRMNALKRLLGELAAQGLTVQLVHRSEATVRKLGAELGVQALSHHTLRYTPVETDCIVLLDGDIIERRTVERLEQLGKDTYLFVPQGALPEVPAGPSLKELLKNTELVPWLGADDSYPRTFGCHHEAETCMLCEGLVTQWKADRRDKAASL